MLVWIFLGLIIVWTINFAKDKDADARFKYGNEVAEHLDLKVILQDSYDGSFAFGEATPDDSIYSDVADRIDQGSARRLGLHFSRRLPKWVLKSAAKDIALGGFKDDGAYMKYVMTEVEEFSKNRNLQIAKAIEARKNPAPQVNKRRRRRR
ncbi:MAG: hypothetical protein ABJO36_01090 [Litorimonas sp.]